MKHWFVIWLEDQAEEQISLANKYRKVIESDLSESKVLLEAFDNDINEIVDRVDLHEQVANKLIKWGALAEDIINCGLEELAIFYYDAKQSIESDSLPLRPDKSITWTINGIAEQLELRMEKVKDPNKLEQLDAIYKTLVELDTSGLSKTALKYYLRAIRKYPELKLPELESHT